MAVDEAEDLEALVLSYALGTAPETERSRVKQAMVQEPALAQLLAEVDDSLEAVVMGLDAPRAPWKTVAESLEGGRRFSHLVPRLATLFDITPDAAAALMERVDIPSEWMEGPGQGVWLMPVAAGQKWSGYLTTLLRLEPGSQLPTHTHGAEEQVLLLEGGYRDDPTGEEFWRGALDVRASGTSHSLTALEGMACVCASVSRFPEDD
ncbi:MAG: cupin domain-containing protein [Myxococcales bacterium]|nr:cupin domain-containing protein [Myxococcales bacterium]